MMDPTIPSDIASEAIANGVERGVTRSRVSLVDRRMLVIYGLLALFTLISVTWQDHTTNGVKRNQDKIVAAQRAAQIVCEQRNADNAKFNKLIDQLDTNIRNSVTLSPAQKADALATYDQVRFTISDCSHLAGS